MWKTIPTWLKTFLFLTFAGVASLTVAASFFSLAQQEFPLLCGVLELFTEWIGRIL